MGQIVTAEITVAIFRFDSQRHITLETPAVWKGAQCSFEADHWPHFGC